jgi:hypothetical protein
LPQFNEIVEFIAGASTMDNHNKSTHPVDQERLRQARVAFKLAYTFLAMTVITGVASLVLIFSGKVSEGKVAASEVQIYGSISVLLLKSAKDAGKRADGDK